MLKKIYPILMATSLGLLGGSTQGATSVATVPDGMISIPFKTNSTSYFSIPLTSVATYTGVVSGCTADTITVDDSPAPFTTNLGTATAPYLVKFLTGKEAGRIMLITTNTTKALRIDTTDHATGAAVALTTTGFSVAVGDAFETFPADTIGSIFGTGSGSDPLLLTGASILATSDTVSLYTLVGSPASTYYFNTTAGFWERYGSTTNANNTVIYPSSAISVVRRAAHASTALVLSGRVTPVSPETKLVGRTSVYSANQFAKDVRLSQLKFASNWQTGLTVTTADTLGIWNAAISRFETFYQLPDLTWRKYGDVSTDQSSFLITAGDVITITKRVSVAGAASFLQATLPYSLN